MAQPGPGAVVALVLSILLLPVLFVQIGGMGGATILGGEEPARLSLLHPGYRTVEPQPRPPLRLAAVEAPRRSA